MVLVHSELLLARLRALRASIWKGMVGFDYLSVILLAFQHLLGTSSNCVHA